MLQKLLGIGLGTIVAASSALAVAATPGIESTYAEHARGVELARAGRYDDGLKVLLPLLNRFPDEYPLVRDVVLINAWKGDCETALSYFDRIRSRASLDDYLIGPVANCAVVRGRAGDYRVAIETLSGLLAQAHDDYPLYRDLAIISHWKGDCPAALGWFDRIRGDPRNPPYLIAPMANCLRRQDRPIESLTLLDEALARYPDDPALVHERNQAEVSLRLDGGLYDQRADLQLDFSSSDSDRDVREWVFGAEGSISLAPTLRTYARYVKSRAEDPAFDAGELNRVGVGLRWRPSARLLIDQGFSGDLRQSDREGSHTRVVYQPVDAWRTSVGLDTYAEDISVRARAAGIEARRGYADLEYIDPRYVWSGFASAGRYDYTDGNQRDVFYATLGYGYALWPEREHRIFLEAYRSRNSLANAVYFNPSGDQSLVLVHRTAFVFDSRFRRHVDTLSLSAGRYTQEGFGGNGIYSIAYEQDYDFDDRQNFVVSAGYGRRYFDGEPENEWEIALHYRRRF